MDRFENVSVVKPANLYFEGRVSSRTVLFADGTKKTLGVMLPGEYEFGTDAAEIMEILSGQMDVLLPGGTAWKKIQGGEEFSVPAKSKFQLKVHQVTDYCCSFLI